MITNLTVQPHWGPNELALEWKTSETPAPDHHVTVLSSIDSEHWVNVSSQGALDTVGQTFIHKEPLSLRRMQEVFYRVIIQTDGQRWDSPSVSAQQLLRPHEFAAVRQMLAHELHNMRVGDGLEVLLLKPLTFGEPADSFDSETGQSLAANQDLSGFGEAFKNGFFPPVTTHMQFVAQKDLAKESPQGKGAYEISVIQARGFCFPRPARGDLIINTAIDERYVVGKVVPYRFRGIVGVTCDITLDVLPRGDIRYKLDQNNVPDPYNQPAE